jgi:hypothetical protein
VTVETADGAFSAIQRGIFTPKRYQNHIPPGQRFAVNHQHLFQQSHLSIRISSYLPWPGVNTIPTEINANAIKLLVSGIEICDK